MYVVIVATLQPSKNNYILHLYTGPQIIIIEVISYYVLNFIFLLTCNFIKLILFFTIDKNVSFEEKNLLIPKSCKSTD